MAVKKLLNSEILYGTALFLILSSLIIESSVIPNMIGSGAFDTVLKIGRYFAYALLVLETVLYKEFTAKEYIWLFVIVGIVMINAHYVGFSIPLRFLLVIGCIGISDRRVMKWELYIMGGWFLFIVLCSQLGIIDNWGFGLEGTRPRYCLGFIYPSHTTSLFFFIVLLYCCVKREKLNLWEVIGFSAVNYWQYLYTDSRAGTLLIFAILAGMWMIRYAWVRKLIDMLPPLQYIFLLTVVITVLITVLYMRNPGELVWLDKALTGRVRLQSAAIQNFGVHLFGQKITWIGNGGTGYTQTSAGGGYNYVDSSFIKVLLDQGLLVWLMVIAGFCGLSIHAGKSHDYYLLFALAALGVYCIVEQWLINPGYNPFFVMLWMPLFRNHIVSDETVYNGGA